MPLQISCGSKLRQAYENNILLFTYNNYTPKLYKLTFSTELDVSQNRQLPNFTDNIILHDNKVFGIKRGQIGSFTDIYCYYTFAYLAKVEFPYNRYYPTFMTEFPRILASEQRAGRISLPVNMEVPLGSFLTNRFVILEESPRNISTDDFKYISIYREDKRVHKIKMSRNWINDVIVYDNVVLILCGNSRAEIYYIKLK
jgi:hypothetical protein